MTRINPIFLFFGENHLTAEKKSNCLQHALEKPPNEMFKLLKQIVPSVQSNDSSVDGSDPDGSMNFFSFFLGFFWNQ